MIAKPWTHYLARHQHKIYAIQFYTKLVCLVWTCILKLWTSRNTDNATATDHFRDQRTITPHIHDQIYNSHSRQTTHQTKNIIFRH